MEALFIGQTYIDVTFIADRIPTGDDKDVARDYAVSFGGNAVTAAFACAKLGIAPDLLTSVADDWLGRMFLDMAAKYRVSRVHPPQSPPFLAVLRSCRGTVSAPMCAAATTIICIRFRRFGRDGCRALHLIGHQVDAAIHYARECRAAGILTSLDGGGMRSNTLELLTLIDVAVVSERFCEQSHLSPVSEVLTLLKAKGCKVGGVTLGERGVLFYGEAGTVSLMPALRVPADEIIDTNGAGDVFRRRYCPFLYRAS